MSLVEESWPCVDWDALAPHIDHPTRRRIVEELEQARDSLSARELCERLDDPRLPLSRVAFHVDVLVKYDVLEEVGERVTARGVEPVFYFRDAAG